MGKKQLTIILARTYKEALDARWKIGYNEDHFHKTITATYKDLNKIMGWKCDSIRLYIVGQVPDKHQKNLERVRMNLAFSPEFYAEIL